MLSLSDNIQADVVEAFNFISRYLDDISIMFRGSTSWCRGLVCSV